MTWNVRRSNGKREGPGNNIFSQYNALLDEDNLLNGKESFHLCCDKEGSAEIYQDKALGYGLYEFDIECPVFLPKDIILGVFLYKDDKEEVDIEFGRWGKTFSPNCQFVLQKTGEIKRFWNLKNNNKCFINFQKDYIVVGVNNKIHVFDSSISKDAKVHINLWHYGDKKTSQARVILKDWRFTK